MKWIIGTLWIVLISSCVEDETQKYQKLQKEWRGNEIKFISDIYPFNSKTDSVLSDSEFKIVMYVDSVGCTRCKMRLYQWYHVLNEINKLTGYKIPLVIIIDENDYKNLSFILLGDRYHQYVYIDNSLFVKQNRVLSNPIYSSLLLDKNNKVLVIGNPTYNPSILLDYLKFIKIKFSIADISNPTFFNPYGRRSDVY